MMKKLLTLFVLTSASMLLHGQQTKVSGTVYDDFLEVLPSAEVRIVTSDSVQVASQSTGADGSFSFGITMENGLKYLLEVTHLSYERQVIPLAATDTVMEIYMHMALYMIEGVDVVAKKPLIEQRGGTTVVNVSQMANVNSMSTTRMLDRLPGVTANEREGLTLNGQGATLYIDGREQSAGGTMALDLLEALPASMIETVELVLANNGTRSALSNGVVINIKMKEMYYDGYFARVAGHGSLAEYPDNDFGGGANGSVIMKKGDVVFNALLSYDNRPTWYRSIDDSRFADGSTMKANSTGDGRINVLTGLANLEWRLKNKHTLNFNFWFYDDFSKSTDLMMLHANDTTGIRDYGQRSYNEGNDDLWTGNIEYSTPDTLPNSFKASYGILYGGLRTKSNRYNILHPDGLEQWSLYTYPRMTGWQHDLKFDYTHLFRNSSKLLAGVLLHVGILDDDVKYDEPVLQPWHQSSNMHGVERNFEGYVNYNFDFGRFFSMDISSRFVHINRDFDFVSDGKTLQKDYNYLLPFAAFYYRNKIYSLGLGMSSQLSNPDYSAMLPGNRQVDEYTVRIGNPDVNPSRTYGFLINQSFFNACLISVRYVYKYDIAAYLLDEESSADLRVYRYKNVYDTRSCVMSLTSLYRMFGETITGRVEVSASYKDEVNFKNGYHLDAGRKSSYWQTTLSGSMNYNILDGLDVYLWAKYWPRTKMPEKEISSYWTMDAGVSYCWGKDGMFSLVFDAQDIFSSLKISSCEHLYGNVIDNTADYANRVLKLTFAVKFKGGGKVDDKGVNESKNDIGRFR